jgi:hypothetical protein
MGIQWLLDGFTEMGSKEYFQVAWPKLSLILSPRGQGVEKNPGLQAWDE